MVLPLAHDQDRRRIVVTAGLLFGAIHLIFEF